MSAYREYELSALRRRVTGQRVGRDSARLPRSAADDAVCYPPQREFLPITRPSSCAQQSSDGGAGGRCDLRHAT